jgi:predicted Zn-dependent protease
MAAPVADKLGGPAKLDEVRPSAAGTAKPAPIVATMTTELARSMSVLKKHSDPPYFAAYEVTDTHSYDIRASFGVLESSTETRKRYLDVEVRVGDHKLDNTHQVRERFDFDFDVGSGMLPYEDDDFAIRTALWLRTDAAYKRAAEQFTKVQANTRVKVKADDPSDDFSAEPASEYFAAPAEITLDTSAWEKRLRVASAVFRKHPQILDAGVWLSAGAETHYYTSSDGTRYQVPRTHVRVAITATTKADDGMLLRRFESFDVTDPKSAPTDEQLRGKIDRVIADLLALRAAPVAEPYLGPAILEGKAAGVFFHEVFGHRVEGHRQKREDEGQTFAKKIGQTIMPGFMNVYDDPTIAMINGHEVNGFYRYDNEGVVAQRASLVEAGVLKTFLLGRSPTRGFTRSNGHGRRQQGRSVVARQGNLVVAPSQTVDRDTLRRKLLEEVKKQGKPYGIILRELDGGFTMTMRFAPQAFKLLPIMVYRLYPDGREELVRGADLEGTPQLALASIAAAGDDVETFNGYCGAESGFVPVSATSPSLLVTRLEVAKKDKEQDKPPILPPPPMTGGAR